LVLQQECNIFVPKPENSTAMHQPAAWTKSSGQLSFAAFIIASFLSFQSCKKEKEAGRIPVVQTLEVTEIGPNSAKAGGKVLDEGGSPVEMHGLIWSDKHNPLLDNYLGISLVSQPLPGVFESVMTDLQPAKTYYFRAYATNKTGTAYGELKSFVSAEAPNLPVAAFSAEARIGFAPFVVNFIDASDFEPHSWHWDFGDGHFSELQNPSHTYVEPGRYSVKLKVTNETGTDSLRHEAYITAAGTAQACEGMLEFTDARDGKTYPTVKIGEQCWMGKNLDFDMAGSWCYGDKNSNCQNFGRLYHWDAAIAACPEGWLLPSDDDWRILESFLDTQTHYSDSTWLQNNAYRGVDAGMRMKAVSGWFSNGDGYDSHGFTALPGGYRNFYGDFESINYMAMWWSSTEQDSLHVYHRGMHSHFNNIHRRNYFKLMGLSVRCIRE
jgi:uncharacterized protein (TIGR02145 family)